MTLAKQILARRIGAKALKDLEIKINDFMVRETQCSLLILPKIWLVKNTHQLVICSDVLYSGQDAKTPYFVLYNSKLYQTHWAEGVLLFLKGTPPFSRDYQYTSDAPCWHSTLASTELDDIDQLIKKSIVY